MNTRILSVLASICLLGAFLGSNVYADTFEDRLYNIDESSIAGMLVGALVGVVVAGALLPVIANQTAVLETDSAGDLDTNEETLIGLWPLLIIVGVMMAIIGFAL